MATIDDVYYLLIQFLGNGIGATYFQTAYTPSTTTGTSTHDGYAFMLTEMDYIYNRVGATPSGGIHQIYNQVDDLDTLANDASHGFAALRGLIINVLNSVESLSTQENTHYDLLNESIENAEAQATTAADNSSELVSNGGSLIMNEAGIGFPKFGGGALAISLVQLLSSLISSPPIGLLTQHLELSFTGDHTLVPAVGVYGAVLNLSVPAGWGRTAGVPSAYVPPAGRAQWLSVDGALDNPIPLESNTAVFFPAPNLAVGLAIHLAPGVIGQLYSLRLI